MGANEEYEKNWWITEAMIRRGGSFVAALGKLFRIADSTNQSKLERAFPEYWNEYEKIGKELRGREDAEMEE